jgi:hypothetical protein
LRVAHPRIQEGNSALIAAANGLAEKKIFAERLFHGWKLP